MIILDKLKLKNQRKTLKILSVLCDSTSNGILCKPEHFTENFSFLDSLTLTKMLKLLEEKNLIEVQYADYPDNFNIYTLKITPEGLDFEPQISYDNLQRWIDRIWGFLTGTLLTIIIEFLLGLL